jgi:hypothetical protein
MKHWQPGLISFENISGILGEVATKSLLKKCKRANVMVS